MTENVQSVRNRGHGTVMVWGGIGRMSKTTLVRLSVRLRMTPSTMFWKSSLCLCFTDYGLVPVDIFMYDNAPRHLANVTRPFLVDENVPTMVWPAVSPDMNTIKNAWRDRNFG